MTTEQLLISYELELLTPEVRHDQSRLDELLADDFFECGKTGMFFGKKECLDWLPREQSKHLEADNICAHELSEQIWQIRYQLRMSGDGEELTTSFRTSLWRKSAGGWQMFFHQGTLLL